MIFRPVGWGTSACAMQACFSPSESLREADVRLPSSGKMEITLQDLPFDLDFFKSHCSSWARSGVYSHDFPGFQCQENKILSLLLLCWKILQPCFWGWSISVGTMTFEKVQNSKVTMFAVTFFCSDFKVRTLAFDQSLNFVLEDKAFIGRMMHHPMK